MLTTVAAVKNALESEGFQVSHGIDSDAGDRPECSVTLSAVRPGTATNSPASDLYDYESEVVLQAPRNMKRAAELYPAYNKMVAAMIGDGWRFSDSETMLAEVGPNQVANVIRTEFLIPSNVADNIPAPATS